MRNFPASRFNVRRAANCLHPPAGSAWRASTPLIPRSSSGRLTPCHLQCSRPAPKPRRNECHIPGAFSSSSWESLSVLLCSSKLSGRADGSVGHGGAQVLAGVWVFYDALRLRIPRPLRWAVGSILLPIVIFPGTWLAEEPPGIGAIRGSGGGAGDAGSARRRASILPGQFDFLHRAWSTTRDRANSRA